MSKLSFDIFSLDYDRRIEIIERSKNVKRYIDSKFFSKRGQSYGMNFKIEVSYTTYKNLFKEELTDDEKTILHLYIIFPDDEVVLDLINRYSKDYAVIGKFYGVSSNFVKLRYLNIVNMKALKENIKTLKYENKNE